MADYKKMYFLLFDKITDTIENLQEIQQLTEKMYLAQEKARIRLVDRPTKEEQNS